MNIMAIDIGGSFSKIMVMTDGKEEIFYEIPTRASLGIGYLKADIFNEISKNIENYSVEKIGISTAGIVDDRGVVLEVGGAFKDYAGFSWVDEIKNEYDLDAIVINDVKAAALGEYYYGAGSEYDSIYILTVGTGIGGAFINKGEIYRGYYGNAGEIGYVPRENSNIGALASTGGLVRRAQNLYADKDYKNGKEIFEGLTKGEKEAQDLVDYMTMALAELIGSIVLILDPQAILLGGAVSKQGETLLDPIEAILKRELPKEIYKNLILKPTSLENKAACYGAVYLAVNKLNQG